MKDILLINPTSSSEQNLPPPLSLIYLAGFLEKHKYSVSILDLVIDPKSDEEIINRIKEVNPKKIGFSCMSLHVPFIKRITNKIKENFKVPIIIGGIHPTALPEKSVEEMKDVDLFVLGEGELTLLEIMQDKPLKKIKGLAYRSKGIKVNPKRDYIPNLDDIPFPARHLIDLRKYTLGLDWEGRKPATIMFTSRGCPFDCIYCASKVMWTRKIRFMSAKKVLEEIDYLIKKYGVREILFYDDHFTFNRGRLKEICNELIKRKYDLAWCCLSRVDIVDSDMIRLMKRAGCHMISFGVESGSQTILDAMQKNVKVEKILNAFKICREVGMNTKASIIFGGPKESFRTVEETKRVLKKILPDYLWLFIMTPLPGTKLYQLHKESGLGSENWEMYDQTTYNVFYDTDLNYKDLRKIVSDAYKGYYFSVGYMLSQIRKLSVRKINTGLKIMKYIVPALKYSKSGREKK
ncbi:oxygen-independent coproporphyrinogen-III oxidase 1 [archaeon BMS3Abin17]|nr:oxygen-independent coproporphyrinogen-III oxidase 1 [archaeon BMS3Abin17]HDZ60326.1 radical SAM protein [Candidatus Pacearchaeota archaeon]